MASENVIHVTDATFAAEVLQSTVPVLVDFWAEWCPPCKMLGPVLDEIAAENSGVKIAKVDVDGNSATAAQYSVRNIPTLLFVKDGKVVSQVVGAGTSKKELAAKLTALI